jgi:hypothetical protein
VEGTPWRRIKEALRTKTGESRYKYTKEGNIPNGSADEKIIAVITRLMTGSK